MREGLVAKEKVVPPISVWGVPAFCLLLLCMLIFSSAKASSAQTTTAQINTIYSLGKYLEKHGTYEEFNKIRSQIDRKKTIGGSRNVVTHISVYDCATIQLYGKKRDQNLKQILQKRLQDSVDSYGAKHHETMRRVDDLAVFFQLTGENDQAALYHERALQTKKRILGWYHPSTFITRVNLAEVYLVAGKTEKAIPQLEESLLILDMFLDPYHTKTTYIKRMMASAFKAKGIYDSAEKYYLSALRAVSPSDKGQSAEIKQELAELYFSIGEYEKVEKYLTQALATRQKIFGESGIITLQNKWALADFYRKTGQYDTAEKLLKQLLITEKDNGGKATYQIFEASSSLAMLYHSTGNFNKATFFYKEALGYCDIENEKILTNYILLISRFSSLYRTLNKLENAENLLTQALGEFEEKHFINKEKLEPIFTILANIYLENGKTKKAESVMEQLGVDAGWGYFYLMTHKYKEALKYWVRADWLKTADKVTCAIGLALAYEGLGELSKSREYFLTAIQQMESHWKRLSLVVRKTFLDGGVGGFFKRIDAYDGLLRITFKHKGPDWEKSSLQVSESVKSRTLIEILAARKTAGNATKTKEVFNKDRIFQQKIAALGLKINQLSASGGDHTDEFVKIQAALNALLSKYEEFINEIKLNNQELASLLDVQTFDIVKLQKKLPKDTTLIEYYIAKDSICIWVVTSHSIKVSMADVPKATLVGMVNDLLRTSSTNGYDESEMTEQLALVDRGIKPISKRNRPEDIAGFLQQKNFLYKNLISPVKKYIKTKKLIIVPHGILHKLPFAALSEKGKYLVDDHIISILPSAGVYEFVTDNINEDDGSILALVDPYTEYQSLTFAEMEVAEVKKSFKTSEIFAGSKATETEVWRRSGNADVLHFASHGIFNDAQPMQSGLLLTADDENDGMLQVHEIFDLNLSKANLVTLSACETGISKVQGGDDLIGLSRGFIYAGAPSILATLWKVNDRSTALFMTHFYDNWRNRGMTKAEAVQKAQLYLKEETQYKEPYYWAPFILIGESGKK